MKFTMFFAVGLLFSLSARAGQIIPFLVANGDTYVAAEITVNEAGSSNPLHKNAIEVSQEFLKNVKVNGVKASYKYFSENDGSRSTIIDGKSILNLEALRTRVSGIDYSDSIVWGEYLLMPVKYDTGKRKIDFREDYDCQAGECLKSVFEFGQVFENVYSVFVNQRESVYSGSLSNILVKGNKKIFASKSPGSEYLVSSGPSKGDLKLGITLKEVTNGNCLICDETIENNGLHDNIVVVVRQFANEYRAVGPSVYLPDTKDNKLGLATLKRYSHPVSGIRTIPMVSWSNGKPSLKHVNLASYLGTWRQYLEGTIEGYILDQDYAYIVVSKDFEIKGKNEKRFQIFVSRLVTRQGETNYLLDPETSEDLESQYLVFDTEFLRVLNKVVTGI